MKQSSHRLALGLVVSVVLTLGAAGLSGAKEPAPSDDQDGARHFVEIANVLQSPRCQNCHPAGDAPLHGDQGVPHSMNVSRKSVEASLTCTTCHRSENQPMLHAPPGVPGWRMPDRDMPLVFEGLPVRELCERMKDPVLNGNRSLEQLVEHMGHDPFVLWAWAPGPGRTTPPMSHDALMQHVRAWVAAGAPCPR